MGTLIRKQLSGNILEPLIALILVVIALTGAFAIVLKAKNNYNLAQVARANVTAGRTLYRTIEQELYIDDEKEEDGLIIEKHVDWYNKANNLMEIQIKVLDRRNRILAHRCRIIIMTDDEEN